MNNISLSPQTRSSIRIWGLIGAGILAGIEIIWYILTYFWLGDFIYSLISHLPYIIDYTLLADVLFACLPVLAALPIFFWTSQQVARQTSLVQGGIRAAFQACGWWAIIKILLLSFDIWQVVGLDRLNTIAYMLSFLLMFGAGWWMGTLGGRSGGSQSAIQAGQYSLQPGPLAPAPSAPLGIAPQQPIPQAYQSPQPLSALEILQQRFARGEIDPATYQQIRAQLEASAHPNPNLNQ